MFKAAVDVSSLSTSAPYTVLCGFEWYCRWNSVPWFLHKSVQYLPLCCWELVAKTGNKKKPNPLNPPPQKKKKCTITSCASFEVPGRHILKNQSFFLFFLVLAAAELTSSLKPKPSVIFFLHFCVSLTRILYPNSCLCSLILGLPGGSFSRIDYLSVGG